MFSFLNLFEKGVILLIILLFILKQTNSTTTTPDNGETTTILSSKTENKIVLPWENYNKMTEHKREKREFLAISGILILVLWSFTLGPFTQMQITSRVNMIGSFQEKVKQKSLKQLNLVL